MPEPSTPGLSTPELSTLLRHVDADRVVDLASALVRVPTTNPPGNEAALGPVLRDALSPWAPTWEEVEPAPGRTSFIARLPSPEGEHVPTLIVNAHVDVVPVVASRWSRDPFEPVLLDGRLYGRGAADMKGGTAAAICALAALGAAGLSRSCELVFQFVADEERGGGLGTRILLERGYVEGDACLVPEPTALDICVAERGLLQGEILVKGRPGHGSRPREGVSAVEHGAQIVLALHAADFGGPDHPLLGRPTANIGTFNGGSALNIVAEEARIGFDKRLLPGTSLDEAVETLRARIKEAGIRDADYQIEVFTYAEGSEMTADHPLTALAARCVGLARGEVPSVIGMTFTTDARFVRNQAGVPAVVCGPGSVAQAHGIDEWVSVEQLVQATAAYAEIFRSLGPG